VIVRVHPSKSWDRGIDGLKVEKVERVFQLRKFRRQFRAEPRLPGLDARSGSSLNLRQFEVAGNITDRLDALFLQFFAGAGLEVWQVTDVVVRSRGVAVVEELADDGLKTVFSCGKVWFRIHLEDSEL
jgi:hypothetical protein